MFKEKEKIPDHYLRNWLRSALQELQEIGCINVPKCHGNSR